MHRRTVNLHPVALGGTDALPTQVIQVLRLSPCLPLCLSSPQHVLRSIQPDVKLSSLRAMADTASRTAEGLAARQAECLHSVCHELFCSAEITRQGDLQLWEPAYERWRKCHFVLTRAGGWGATGAGRVGSPALPASGTHCLPNAACGSPT